MRHALQLCLLWLLAGLFQPLAAPLIGVVIGWHQLGLVVWKLIRQRGGQAVDWSSWRRVTGWLLAAAFLPGLFTAYNLGISLFDAYARIWAAQNVIRSPNILHYLLAYGLLIPYAWAGREAVAAQGVPQRLAAGRLGINFPFVSLRAAGLAAAADGRRLAGLVRIGAGGAGADRRKK